MGDQEKTFPITVKIEDITYDQLAKINWPLVPLAYISGEDVDKLIEINIYVLVYQVGVMFVDGNFTFWNDWFNSGPMTIDEALNFIRQFEEHFKNEIWFQQDLYSSNRASILRGLQSKTGGSEPHVSVRESDNQ